jgi:hypothetical protein
MVMRVVVLMIVVLAPAVVLSSNQLIGHLGLGIVDDSYSQLFDFAANDAFVRGLPVELDAPASSTPAIRVTCNSIVCARWACIGSSLKST